MPNPFSRPHIAWLVLLVAGVIAATWCGRLIWRPEFQEPSLEAIGRAWLEAVAEADATRALALARCLVGDVPQAPQIDAEYAELCRQNGVKPGFLTGRFNRWDFQAWSDALFFHELARQLTADGQDPMGKLFEHVHATLAPRDLPPPATLWPRTVWEAGAGLCDRQAWVLAELAHQLGLEAQVVYLRDPNTGVSPHTICEVRSPQGEVWVADPFSGVLLPGVSVADLGADPALAQRTWPDRPDWQRAIGNPVFWIPAFPQDYCRRNQSLHERLSAHLPDDVPRFGGDPRQRATRFAALAPGNPPSRLWFYPFRLLRADILGARR